MRGQRIVVVRIKLTREIEPFDLPSSSGLREKSFAMTLHIELRPLLIDLLELRIEPEFLLFGWKNPVDIRLLELLSPDFSGPVVPFDASLSSLGFNVLDSVTESSGLSEIVSWTTPSSSE